MIPLAELLARFKNLTNTEKIKKELVCGILKKYRIPVTTAQVLFSKNTIFLKVPPIIKTEIMLHKIEILKKINSIPVLHAVREII
jgi:hypothetical protein